MNFIEACKEIMENGGRMSLKFYFWNKEYEYSIKFDIKKNKFIFNDSSKWDNIVELINGAKLDDFDLISEWEIQKKHKNKNCLIEKR